MEGWKASHEAVYDFTADDGIGHRAWVIDGEKEKATSPVCDLPFLVSS